MTWMEYPTKLLIYSVMYISWTFSWTEIISNKNNSCDVLNDPYVLIKTDIGKVFWIVILK